MIKKESIDDRLTRLNKELDGLLDEQSSIMPNEQDGTMDNLTRLLDFGLTAKEAKAWLKYEPSFMPADEKKQHEETDEDETKPPTEAHICSQTVNARFAFENSSNAWQVFRHVRRATHMAG